MTRDDTTTAPSPSRRSNPDVARPQTGPARRLLARWLPPVLGGVAALALIFWLSRDLDFGRFVDGLRRAPPGWIAMLALTILLEQLVNGWKWRQPWIGDRARAGCSIDTIRYDERIHLMPEVERTRGGPGLHR